MEEGGVERGEVDPVGNEDGAGNEGMETAQDRGGDGGNGMDAGGGNTEKKGVDPEVADVEEAFGRRGGGGKEGGKGGVGVDNPGVEAADDVAETAGGGEEAPRLARRDGGKGKGLDAGVPQGVEERAGGGGNDGCGATEAEFRGEFKEAALGTAKPAPGFNEKEAERR